MLETAPPAPGRPGSRSRWLRWLEPLIGVLLFAVAAWVLQSELEQVRYSDIVAALRALPLRAELMALLFMAANYLILTGCDLLAFVYIGRWVAPWRVMAASFVGYAISNNVGFTLLSGTSARYRFYSRWGLTPGDLSRVVVFYTGTFWVGLLLLGGWTLAFHPHPALTERMPAALIQGAGVLLLLMAAAYAIAPFFRRTPVRIWNFEIPIPPPRLVFGQFALSTTDWVLAASIFYALLPAGGPTFGQVLAAFLASQLLALVSHVPGGLGVFEGTMLLLLGAHLPTETLLGSLILFRIVYYLIPLALALLILLADEVRQRRQQVRQLGSAFGTLAFAVVPKVLAVFSFIGGAMLVFSATRPPEPVRLQWLGATLPLGIIEAAYVAASVTGVGLLVLSHGIAHRLNSAYRASLGLLLVGIVSLLAKGGDYEEALILCGLLAVLVPTGAHFDRRRSFWQTRFSGAGIAATVVAVAACIWLGLLAHREVGDVSLLPWRFDLRDDAARYLRASAAAMLALLGFGVARFFRPRPPDALPPTAEEVAEAERISIAHGGTDVQRLLGGGRGMLWSAGRDAFLVYGVQGRTWVALGEPVGPEARIGELVRRFVERADDFNARPVFYGIAGERLGLYTDFGLASVAIGAARQRALAAGCGGGDGVRYLAYPGGLPLKSVFGEVEAVLRATPEHREATAE